MWFQTLIMVGSDRIPAFIAICRDAGATLGYEYIGYFLPALLGAALPVLRGELIPLVPCLCERLACCLVARSHRPIEKLEMQCYELRVQQHQSAASFCHIAPFSTKLRELCVCMRTGYIRTYVGRERPAYKQKAYWNKQSAHSSYHI